MKPTIRPEDLAMVQYMKSIAETLVKSEWEKKYLRHKPTKPVEDKSLAREKRFRVVKEDLCLIYD